MSLKTLLEKILPFLFSAVEREFDKLPSDQKASLINQGQFGQIIKTELMNGYDAIVKVAADKLDYTEEQVSDLVTALAKKFGVPINAPNEFIDHLQNEVNDSMEDSAWDALWTNVSGQLMIIAGGGAISWPALAFGLIQFVYQRYIQPKA